MYEKRIRILIIFSSAMLFVCILRLAQMQFGSSVQTDIQAIKDRRGSSLQLKTLRGKILDRNSKVLATDEARFQLCITYSLCSILDPNVRKTALAKAARKSTADPMNTDLREAYEKFEAKLEAKRNEVVDIVEKCSQFGIDPGEIMAKIRNVNKGMWKLKTFLAWRRGDPDPGIVAKYGGVGLVPLAQALPDFQKNVPNEEKRLELIANVTNLPEMDKPVMLLELKNDEHIFNAQVEFHNVEGMQILPREQRFYPYKTVAAQTIGWVGEASQAKDLELFASNKLTSYLDGEVCGREDGVEYVCESILRGKRGERKHDIDKQLVSETLTQFGKDVYLTLDIELQKAIEEYLIDYNHDPNCGPGMAAAVIEVATGDILALVSLPLFDLNLVRDDYVKLTAPKYVNERLYDPLRNRAIYQRYPPGSVVKPAIFIAAAESGVATSEKTIPCPAQKAPRGWPSCWIYNMSNWRGHDNKWPNNNARNAIRGSCNIYFSRLADLIEPLALQQWLFGFGYGRSIVPAPTCLKATEFDRSFRHFCGRISTGPPTGKIHGFGQVPSLTKFDRRWLGIGHGKFLATPLQVANAMATLARDGIYMNPQLFLNDPHDPNTLLRGSDGAVDLGISPENMSVVWDGMSAVVYEVDGTAHKTFKPFLDDFATQDVKIWGKTGSTNPPNAWFAGFAIDSQGRKIAMAVVLEGGQSGASDAAPLGRDIIQLTIDAGYVGQAMPAEEI